MVSYRTYTYIRILKFKDRTFEHVAFHSYGTAPAVLRFKAPISRQPIAYYETEGKKKVDLIHACAIIRVNYLKAIHNLLSYSLEVTV